MIQMTDSEPGKRPLIADAISTTKALADKYQTAKGAPDKLSVEAPPALEDERSREEQQDLYGGGDFQLTDFR